MKSWRTCDAQGSGIAFNFPLPLLGYTPTNDDKTNPNSLIGSLVSGSDFFRNVFEWNVVYNNALTRCGNASNPYHSDGNGIIMVPSRAEAATPWSTSI